MGSTVIAAELLDRLAHAAQAARRLAQAVRTGDTNGIGTWEDLATVAAAVAQEVDTVRQALARAAPSRNEPAGLTDPERLELERAPARWEAFEHAELLALWRILAQAPTLDPLERRLHDELHHSLNARAIRAAGRV